MFKKLHDFRIYLLLIPACIAIYFGLQDVAYAWASLMLAVPVFAGIALALRKFLFHTDVSAAADEAMLSPTGAGLVVIADRIFVVAIFLGGILWLRH